MRIARSTCLLAALAIACAMVTARSNAASSSVTVTLDIASATSLSSTGCARATPATTLGVVQPGTSVVTAADCTVAFGSTNDSSMLRLRQQDGIGRAMWMAADGSADTTFGSSGTAVLPIGTGNNSAFAGLMQPDGKYVSAGYAYNGVTNEIAVSRMNMDGSLDTTFGTGGIGRYAVGSGTSQARALALQGDGKLLVAGYSVGAGGQDVTVIRLNANGTLDAGFGTSGVATTAVVTGADQARDVILQPDGKILVAGVATNGANDDMVLLRYTAAGVLDAGFGSGGIVIDAPGAGEDAAESVDLQPDGRIVVAGHTFDGAFDDVSIIRYDQSGARDTSFGAGGLARIDIGAGHDRAFAVEVQPDGRIVAGGSSSNGTNDDFAMIRVDASGALDSSFSGDGWVRTPVNVGDVIQGIGIMGDGRIVAAGASDDGNTTDVAVARYEGDGSPDTSFSGDGVDRVALAAGNDQLSR